MIFPTTDPTRLIQMRDSIYATDLLILATGRLDFFSWLSDNPSNFENICSHFKLDPRPADVMLTLFHSYELVYKQEGIFYNSPLAEEHLTSESSWSLVPYYAIQTERPIVDKMYEVLTTGVPASWGGKMDEEEWATAMQKPEFAKKFTKGMNSRGAYLALHFASSFDFKNYNSMLDIAGGSGIYAATVANLYDHLKVSVLERPPVDQVARKSLQEFNSGNKVAVIPGDMFKDPLPAGYDIHLYSHVLHDWNAEQNKELIRKSYQELNEGGSILILDAHLDKHKDGPVAVAEYSVLLMFATPGKCYSIGEMEHMLLEAGFKDIHYLPLVVNRSLIIGKK